MTEVNVVKIRPASAVAGSVLPGRTRKRRVAAYCRVSTLLDSQETSIRSQREHYTACISACGDWEFAGIYLETGVSGTKAEIRPELQRMMADCRAGRIDMILTKSISRFARDTQDCLEMVRALTALGVTIRFEKERIDTGAMSSELMLSLLACFAESESHSISGNMKWAIRRQFAAGTYRQPVPPYGYTWSKGRLVIVPDQAEVVREIFRLAQTDMGCGRIASRLNARQIPSPRGKQWGPGTIRQMLCNTAYIGEMLCQKSYMDAHFNQKRNRGELDQFRHADHHAAIISRETFESTALALRQRARAAGCQGNEPSGSGSISRYGFSGILTCASCGSVMHRQIGRGGRVKWICSLHSACPDRCRMLPQSDADLKAAALNCLNKLAWGQKQKEPHARILDVYEMALSQSEADYTREHLTGLEDQLALIGQELRKLTAMAICGQFRPEHREEKTLLQAKVNELMAEKARIQCAGALAGALDRLRIFIDGWSIAEGRDRFPDQQLPGLVAGCTVHSRRKVTFRFHCGLQLTESLVRRETVR